MAEIAAGIGLAASILSLIDIATKLTKCIKCINDQNAEVPLFLQSITNELSIREVTLQLIKQQIHAGCYSDDVAKVLQHSVDRLNDDLTSLYQCLNNFILPANGPRSDKVIRIVKSSAKNKSIKQAFENVQRTMTALSELVIAHNVKSNYELIRRLEQLSVNLQTTQQPRLLLCSNAIDQIQPPSSTNSFIDPPYSPNQLLDNIPVQALQAMSNADVNIDDNAQFLPVQSRIRQSVKWQHRSSICQNGICQCACHKPKYRYRALFIVSAVNIFSRCSCQRRDIRLEVSMLQKVWKVWVAIDRTQGLHLERLFRVQNTVKRTSPGFLVIEKFHLNLVSADEVKTTLRALRGAGLINFNDVNTDGESMLESVISKSWGWARGFSDSHLQIMDFLIQERAFIDSERLIRRCLRLVGEGAFIPFLEKLAKTTLDASNITPSLFSIWPRAASSDWIYAYHSGDSFYIETIALLVESDLEFGGTTLLQAAIHQNDYSMVRKLSKLSSVPGTDKNFLGQSILHLAVLNPAMVQCVLQCFSDLTVDAKDKCGSTPLMYAMSYGIIESVRLLLEAGADPYMRDDLNNFCAWHYALLCDDIDLLKVSFETLGSVASTNFKQAVEYCVYILILNRSATHNGFDLKKLTFLLQHWEGNDFQTAYGNTLLHLCSSKQFALLLDVKGISIDSKNKRGYTPLMVAARTSKPATIKRVVEKGAIIASVDEHDRNAMHHLFLSSMAHSSFKFDATSRVSAIESAAILLRMEADLNHGDDCRCQCSKHGCVPIANCFTKCSWSARQASNIEVIPYLLDVWVLLQTMCPADIRLILMAIYRRQRFDELGMTHTCDCLRDTSSEFQSRIVTYTNPYDDEITWNRRAGDSHDARFAREYVSENELEIEIDEIEDEQEDLARLLQADCDKFFTSSSEDLESAWISVLSRRVVMMEEGIEMAARKTKIKREAAARKLSARRVLPELKEELIITPSPLLYVDVKKDMIVDTSFESTINLDYLSRLDYRFEQAIKTYLTAFEDYPNYMEILEDATLDMTMWKQKRLTLVKKLTDEVERLRKAPKAEKDWDMNIE